ncbi:hypothetical protein KCP73_03205 [Salmonella enterica subsp. enterica]|nr:hypothetical protein KCP73_03205 [Salmonella enterica subsp. enterica]
MLPDKIYWAGVADSARATADVLCRQRVSPVRGLVSPSPPRYPDVATAPAPLILCVTTAAAAALLTTILNRLRFNRRVRLIARRRGAMRSLFQQFSISRNGL